MNKNYYLIPFLFLLSGFTLANSKSIKNKPDVETPLLENKIDQLLKEPSVSLYALNSSHLQPSQILEPPEEYTNIIVMGKPAVPYLIKHK